MLLVYPAHDSDDIDHWKIEKYTEDDAKGNTLIDETVFSTLFPKYREAYLREWWSQITAELNKHVCQIATFRFTIEPSVCP